MLVLSRKRNEQVVIGGTVVVTIVEIRGDKVRLGIEAPKEVSVHRREVWDAILNETKQHEARQHPGEICSGEICPDNEIERHNSTRSLASRTSI